MRSPQSPVCRLRINLKRATFLLWAAVCGFARAQSADWLTFGVDLQHSGFNPAETILSQTSVGQLTLQWTGHLHGAASVQALVAHDVLINDTITPIVFMATAKASVEAFNATTGKRIWSQSLASVSPCPNSTLGISGTPVIDLPNQRLFVVDGLGNLHALNLATGAEQPNYPVQIIHDAFSPPHTISHGGLTLVGSELYAVASSACPDSLTPFYGQVVRFDLPTAALAGSWYPLAGTGESGAGVWGAGGVAASYDGSTLYTATGNALGGHANRAPAESVIQLDPQLNILSINAPIASKSGDYDFGSTPLLFTPLDCPSRLAALNKSGSLYLYDPANIGAGALQSISVGKVTGAGDLIGMPAFDPATNAIYFDSPTDAPDGSFHHGLIALQAGGDCLLSPLWNQTQTLLPGEHPAVPVSIANGVVWMIDQTDKQLVAYADDTGALLWTSGSLLGSGGSKTPPTIVNGQVFIGTQDGRLLAFALPAPAQ
jgi:outer membrane protein assembly factor BamB